MTKAEPLAVCSACKRVFADKIALLRETSGWRVASADASLEFTCACQARLTLKKGEYDWLAPFLAMSPQAHGAFDRIKGVLHLPTVPAAVVEVKMLLQDPATPPAKLAGAIKRTPTIAADLLTFANNRSTSPIRTIEHAIVYIGLQALSDLVSTVTIVAFKPATKVYSAEDFWYHGFLCGLIAETLAGEYNCQEQAGEVYVAACLCNVGKLAGSICFPAETDQIFQTVSQPKSMAATTWSQVEAQHELPDHCALGEIAAVLWGLPGYVVEAARFHHNPYHQGRPKPDAPIGLVEIVALANQLTHLARDEVFQIDNALLAALQARFGIDEARLTAFGGTLRALKTKLDQQLKVTIYTYLKFKTGR